MKRVAAAKTGLEVALLWMRRISGQLDLSNNNKVFLGGSCNPTTWRRDIAMPLMEQSGVLYYNPQVEEVRGSASDADLLSGSCHYFYF